MIVDSILDIVGKFVPDANERVKLKAKIEESYKKYSDNDTALRLKELDSKGFKAWWRPALMYSFGLIVVAYSFLAYIMPMIVVYLNLNIWIPTPPEIDPALWDLVKYSILGIGGMRSIDKRR